MKGNKDKKIIGYDMRTFNIKTPDKKIVPALQDKIDNLTKPKGSLGRLEIGSQIGTTNKASLLF